MDTELYEREEASAGEQEWEPGRGEGKGLAIELSGLSGEAVEQLRAEAMRFARWEVRRYACWREGDVLPSGYDVEGVVQGAFERLLARERSGVSKFDTVESLGRALRSVIKHQVRGLHEKMERRFMVRRLDDDRAQGSGEGADSVEPVPGQLSGPEEELLRKEREQLLTKFKVGFELQLGERKELVEVFRQLCEGEARQDVAQEMGEKPSRIKAWRAQVKRRLKRFCRVVEG